MKRMRGNLTRKLKSISSLKQSLLFQNNLPNHQLQNSLSRVKFENGKIKISEHTTTKGDPDQELKKDQTEIGTQASILKQTSKEECKKSETEEIEEPIVSSSLQDFEENCPPGGSESVVFYTTSLRGIRKTFEDCSKIRFLLESFRVSFDERDVFMHLEYREELWRLLGRGVIPPRIFIRGRYIGGADEVVSLHEVGNMRKLLKGIPLSPSSCHGCGGVRFVLCFSCNGSRKIAPEAQDSEESIRCSDCNENGLVKCSICSLS